MNCVVLLGGEEVLKVYIVKRTIKTRGVMLILKPKAGWSTKSSTVSSSPGGGVCQRVGCGDVFSKAFPIPFLICDSAGTCGFDGAVPN